ncbi:PilZ domain-containing protein [Pontixanthobacter sp. CEM42]|uniref:PilZ domain-containing protein n=1 Tax=Pontixanthobacter sp. CEM42 TaxID=2792077 RepID=UPI001ADEFA84|nr:PilZ domain-containing protein [Pontixanthobacter sp. CEM42]
MASAALDLSPVFGSDSIQPDQRAAERFRVLMPGSITLLDGVFNCAIEDISLSGARFITDVPLRKGQEGILLCSPLEVLFSVVWTDGNIAGVHFEEEITLGTVRTLRWHNDRFRNQHDAALLNLVQEWASETPDS